MTLENSLRAAIFKIFTFSAAKFVQLGCHVQAKIDHDRYACTENKYEQ